MNPKPLPFIVSKKPKFKPEQRQTPKGRHRMTLVTALWGREGVVMFSDTQETVGGYAKKSVDKLTVWDQGDRLPFRFAIAAATDDTTYLEMLERDIAGALLKLDSNWVGRVESALVDVLTAFYAKHIWPQSKNTHIEFLITIQPLPHGLPDVFHISGTAVSIPSLSEHHKSIGVGAFLADYIVPMILGGGEGLPQLAMAAAYLGKQVHENVDGCGQVDRIVLLGRDGKFREIYSDVIREMEDVSYAMREIIEQAFRGFSEVDDRDEGELERTYISEELQDMRSKYSDLWERMQQQIRAHGEWRLKFGQPKSGTEQ